MALKTTKLTFRVLLPPFLASKLTSASSPSISPKLSKPSKPLFQKNRKEQLRAFAPKQRNPQLTDEGFEWILSGINTRFLRSLPIEHSHLGPRSLFQAQTHDHCQYEVRYNEDWEENGSASMQSLSLGETLRSTTSSIGLPASSTAMA